jgi:hypothetical protein
MSICTNRFISNSDSWIADFYASFQYIFSGLVDNRV